VHGLASFINLALDPVAVQVREQMVNIGRCLRELNPLLCVVLEKRHIHKFFGILTNPIEMLLKVSNQMCVQVAAAQRGT